MTMTRVRLGRQGEELAAGFLRSEGCGIVASNYRCPWGEIDLVAWDGEELAFVEVRTRSSDKFGTPQESITRRKADHLTAAAQHFLQNHYPENDGEELPWRIDLVSIRLPGGRGSPQIDHVKYAVQG
ncbi:MAG: YraN family protein [Chloroflexota bacterium]|nr:YraN family protein [Chloroflexota bacterium]